MRYCDRIQRRVIAAITAGALMLGMPGLECYEVLAHDTAKTGAGTAVRNLSDGTPQTGIDAVPALLNPSEVLDASSVANDLSKAASLDAEHDPETKLDPTEERPEADLSQRSEKPILREDSAGFTVVSPVLGNAGRRVARTPGQTSIFAEPGSGRPVKSSEAERADGEARFYSELGLRGEGSADRGAHENQLVESGKPQVHSSKLVRREKSPAAGQGQATNRSLGIPSASATSPIAGGARTKPMPDVGDKSSGLGSVIQKISRYFGFSRQPNSGSESSPVVVRNGWRWKPASTSAGAPRSVGSRSIPAKDIADPGRSAVSPAADPASAPLTAEQLAQLKSVMAFGVINAAGYAENNFVFKPLVDGQENMPFSARNAGLEGFYWSWDEVEQDFGEEALLHHLPDFFNYLGDLLGAGSQIGPIADLSSQIRTLQSTNLPDIEKYRNLKTMLEGYLPTLQALVKKNTPSWWAREARIYEIFSAEYNLEGKRQAFGLPPGKPGASFFANWRADDLELLKSQGFDTIWLMGIYPMGVRGRKGDGSPYSIQNHLGIDPALGTPEELRALVKLAHSVGMRVIGDFVPNHTSLDSVELAEHPEFFIYKEVDPGANPHSPPIGYFDYYSQKWGRWIWVSYGGYNDEDSHNYWVDTAQLNISNPDAQRYLANAAAQLVGEFDIDGFRVDMAYQMTNAYFSRNWNVQMPQREFLDLLMDTARQVKPDAGFIAEIYDLRDELSAMGFDGLYNKNDMNTAEGQYGWYNAWLAGDLGKIRQANRDIAFSVWQTAGAKTTQFSVNHDESSVQRAAMDKDGNQYSGIGNAWPAMLMMTWLMSGSNLFYGGQEIGYDRPEPDDEPKMISFMHRNAIDYSPNSPFGNPVVRQFSLQTVIPKYQEIVQALGPAPSFKWVEPANRESQSWVGQLYYPSETSPVKDRAYLVIGQTTGNDIPVQAVIPQFGINYSGVLAAYGADVISFPINSAAIGSSMVRAPPRLDAAQQGSNGSGMHFPMVAGPLLGLGAQGHGLASTISGFFGALSWGHIVSFVAQHYAGLASGAGWVATTSFTASPVTQIWKSLMDVLKFRKGGAGAEQASNSLSGVDQKANRLTMIGNALALPQFLQPLSPALVANMVSSVVFSLIILTLLALGKKMSFSRLAVDAAVVTAFFIALPWILPVSISLFSLQSTLPWLLGFAATLVFFGAPIPQFKTNQAALSNLQSSDPAVAKKARESLDGLSIPFILLSLLGNLMLEPVFMDHGRWWNIVGNTMGIIMPLVFLWQLSKAGRVPAKAFWPVVAASAVFAALAVGASFMIPGHWVLPAFLHQLL